MSADRTLTATFEAAPPPQRAPDTRLTRSTVAGHTATFTFAAVGEATGFDCILAREGKHVTHQSRALPFAEALRASEGGDLRLRGSRRGTRRENKTPATKTFRIH